MELRIPTQLPGNSAEQWSVIRYDRSVQENEVEKTISVKDGPLRITIEPWSEGKRVTHSVMTPSVDSRSNSKFPDYSQFSFEEGLDSASVSLRFAAGDRE